MSYVVTFFRDFFAEFHEFVQVALSSVPVKFSMNRMGHIFTPRKPWRNRAFRFNTYWAWKRFWIQERRMQKPLPLNKIRDYVIIKKIPRRRDGSWL
jgi:hypothetical protein